MLDRLQARAWRTQPLGCTQPAIGSNNPLLFHLLANFMAFQTKTDNQRTYALEKLKTNKWWTKTQLNQALDKPPQNDFEPYQIYILMTCN